MFIILLNLKKVCIYRDLIAVPPYVYLIRELNYLRHRCQVFNFSALLIILVAHEDQEHRLVVIDSIIWHNIKNKYGSQKKT